MWKLSPTVHDIRDRVSVVRHLGERKAAMRRALVCLALIGTILLSAAPANALRPDRFQPGPNPDLVVEDVCDFPVLLHDVANNLVVTDFFDQDGNITMEIGTGRLVVQLTRLDEQGNPVTSITRSISGPGVTTFDESGATLVATGPWLFFFLPGEFAGQPDGLLWLTTGRWVWRFEDSGEVTLVSHTGTFEDVCALLA
jgi:hypothetical protein